MSRRADELYDVDDALIDEEGLITLSVFPLRDVVLFPNMVTPLFVTNENTLEAIDEATRDRETMIAVAQKKHGDQQPQPTDLYSVGTEIAVSRLMHIPDGSTSVLTQGRRRVQIIEYLVEGTRLRARARPVIEDSKLTNETLALRRAVLTLFERCVRLNRSLPEEAYVYAVNIDDPGWLADLIASALSLSIPERQTILEKFNPVARLQYMSTLLGKELDVLELEDQIQTQVQNEVDRSQREVYLRERLRAIQTELGETDLWAQELSDMRSRIKHISLPEEVEIRALREVQRLSQMQAMAPEAGIIRAYLDWLMELPWTQGTKDNLDVQHAEVVLDAKHYGLQKAKERILEYIAVRSLAPQKTRQPILCFEGPPGTGKTSLGQSIADALGRKFVRVSLGGVRDEAEIRGHRRTYVGALPGRILQIMRRAGVVNPLFMLDEIDKLGVDFRGDPASALLEVLDPEQNHAFSDHYLELPYDLSKVMFITTANTVDPIPPALLDRMEVIKFSGYIEEEKLIIAKRFLIPRQLEQSGLGEKEATISEAALKSIIREYTWEAGVRNLEREIGKAFRKVARRKAEGRKTPKRITPSMLINMLGPSEITPHTAETEDQVGTATALAWTENGGDSMSVEVLLVEGKGGLQITGQLGDVMQESAQAALSYIKSRADDLGIDIERFEKIDVHLHVPEGSIPKDGPSAGITMATAMASALTERFVRHDVAMSGEITLRGRVLPVGGVREKVLAAYRLKLATVILPKKNKKDLVEIPTKARAALQIQFVDHMDEVLEQALLPAQKPSSPGKKRGSSRSKTSSKS
ncbi:MAG: endopeptidase La [Anaerolineales bacterium]